jgi:hypothetical protein
LNQGYEFSWLEANIYAIIGGMIGVTLFMHISDWLIGMWDRFRHFYFRQKKKTIEIFSKPVADTEEALEIHYQYVDSHLPPPRKVFSSRSRRVVRIWKKYGLIGLAALTPVVFSIPIGTFFMVRLEKNRNRIFLYMLVSVTCWSLILTTFFHLTNVRSLHEVLQ